MLYAYFTVPFWYNATFIPLLDHAASSFFIVIVTTFADAVDLNVVASVIVCAVPPTVAVAPFFVNATPWYPLFAVALAHTDVPFNTAIFDVTAVPVEALVASILVTKLEPVPWSLVTKYESIDFAALTIPVISFAHT